MENYATELPDDFKSWIDFYLHIGNTIGYTNLTFVTYRPGSANNPTEYNYHWPYVQSKALEEIRSLVLTKQEFEHIKYCIAYVNWRKNEPVQEGEFSILKKLQRIAKAS